MHDAPPRATLPVKVTISPRGLGRGPSAGLAFALEVYDALSGHRLAKGRKIAVTGTIDLDGNVGPIGGVRQKVLGAVRRGADMVLVPVENATDGRARPRRARPGRCGHDVPAGAHRARRRTPPS